MINSTHLLHISKPFVLGSQVKQVFYVCDNLQPLLYIVIPGKRHILWVEDVIDENKYDSFDDTSPLYVDADLILNGDNFNSIYMHSDLTKDNRTYVKE